MTNRAATWLLFLILAASFSALFKGYGFVFIISSVAFAAIVIITTLGLAEVYINLEGMSHIERSLELFYRPLQNLFNGQDNDLIKICEENKVKYNEIGYYLHLAEPDVRTYFEKYPQTNENLEDLLKQVRKDINALQDKYEQLKEL
ncbi:MAG TPA: hypothetical protein VGK06_05540 [Methanosarcina sp.]|jgi:hypothetical protein